MGSISESIQIKPANGIHPILISMEDLQRTIGCGRTTAFAIVGRGEIETVQIGRKRLAVVASVQGYVERLRQTQRLTADPAPLAQASLRGSVVDKSEGGQTPTLQRGRQTP